MSTRSTNKKNSKKDLQMEYQWIQLKLIFPSDFLFTKTKRKVKRKNPKTKEKFAFHAKNKTYFSFVFLKNCANSPEFMNEKKKKKKIHFNQPLILNFIHSHLCAVNPMRRKFLQQNVRVFIFLNIFCFPIEKYRLLVINLCVVDWQTTRNVFFVYFSNFSKKIIILKTKYWLIFSFCRLKIC